MRGRGGGGRILDDVLQRSVVIRPDAEALIELARKHKLFVRTEEPTAKKKRGGLIADLLGLAAATLLQGGLKVATSQISQAFAGPRITRTARMARTEDPEEWQHD